MTDRDYELYIRDPYFTQIEEGIKTSEGRIAKNWLRTIPIGSTLNFKQGKSDREVATLVRSLHIYSDFRSMLEEEGVESMLPGCESVSDGVAIYEGLPRFKEQAAKFGVIAVRFIL